jgi:hypothetical protein
MNINKVLEAKEAIIMILRAQEEFDNGNVCHAEAILADLVFQLNAVAKLESITDYKLNNIFDYFSELNEIQKKWKVT